MTEVDVITGASRGTRRRAFCPSATSPPLGEAALDRNVSLVLGPRTLTQTLIVTNGMGRAQREGGPIEEIRPGDVVWVPPNEKHWHGASPTTAMTHIAIQESLDGKAVDSIDRVTDEQYDRQGVN